MYICILFYVHRSGCTEEGRQQDACIAANRRGAVTKGQRILHEQEIVSKAAGLNFEIIIKMIQAIPR